MKNIEEAVNMHIMERNMETANGEEPGAIFQTALTQEDLNSPDFPTELKQEILYVRAKLANSAITTTPLDYNASDLTTADLFFVDSSVAEGKEKAYVYDEQSKSVYKAKPTIISGKSMFGYDYGKIIGVQGLLASQENDKLEETVNLEGWNGKANSPKIGSTGLIPVTINENTGAVTEVAVNSVGWYDYIAQTETTETGGTSKWANAITKNSSSQITGMFVWIPRFAYRITEGFHKSGDELQDELGKTSGTIDVVFLKETTDIYEKNGKGYTAKRLSQQGVDTNKDYYVVHPCFTKTLDGEGNKTYNQGEWDEELTGIWVAKFEAGFAGGTINDENENTVTITNSNIKYSANCQTEIYYGTIDSSTYIKYPVFLPKTYSVNYITIDDAYRISREIGNDNTYFNLSNTDSHMMKNSEWGAVAYLAQSQYGRNGTEITINNAYQRASRKAYMVTGYGGNTVNEQFNFDVKRNSWETEKGKLASSTGNVYGIYDLSGGTAEYVTVYIINNDGRNQRNLYGTALIEETNEKYKTIYNYDNTDTRWLNYLTNSTKRGDALYETSYGIETSTNYLNSWNLKQSAFAYSYEPYILRGGSASNESTTGIFAFGGHSRWCRSNSRIWLSRNFMYGRIDM